MGNEKSLPDRYNFAHNNYHPHQPKQHQPNLGHQHQHPHRISTTDSLPPSASHYRSYNNTSRPPSCAPSTTPSSAYSSASVATLSTIVSDRSSHSASQTSQRSSIQPVAVDSKQTKYLKEQLYIKSYLDIVEQDRHARTQFQTAKPGIRNYTPKILVQTPPKKELDVWI